MPTMDLEFRPNMNRLVNEPEIVVMPNGERRYKIEIYTTEEAVAGVVELLHMMQGLNERLSRAVKNTTSQERGLAKAQILHDQQRAIADLYREHRAKGYSHRKALANVVDTALAQRLSYTKADIDYCRKAFPTPAKVYQELPYKEQVIQGLDQVKIMSTTNQGGDHGSTTQLQTH